MKFCSTLSFLSYRIEYSNCTSYRCIWCGLVRRKCFASMLFPISSSSSSSSSSSCFEFQELFTRKEAHRDTKRNGEREIRRRRRRRRRYFTLQNVTVASVFQCLQSNTVCMCVCVSWRNYNKLSLFLHAQTQRRKKRRREKKGIIYRLLLLMRGGGGGGGRGGGWDLDCGFCKEAKLFSLLFQFVCVCVCVCVQWRHMIHRFGTEWRRRLLPREQEYYISSHTNTN